VEEAQGLRHLARRVPVRSFMTPYPCICRVAYVSFVAEEVMASMRHSVVNDLTALAAAATVKIEHLVNLPDPGARLRARPHRHDPGLRRHGQVGGWPSPSSPSRRPAPRRSTSAPSWGTLLRAMPAPKGVTVSRSRRGPLWMRIEQGARARGGLPASRTRTTPWSASGGTSACAARTATTIRSASRSLTTARRCTKARSRVFDPFFSTKPGHLGLGLNIVRRIVGRWGGTFDLAPGEPKGVIRRSSCPFPRPAAAKPRRNAVHLRASGLGPRASGELRDVTSRPVARDARAEIAMPTKCR
jgi:hypothetical protein